MKKLSLFFILSSLFFHLVLAQAPKDNFVHLTEDKGLPGIAEINVIYQDRLGYIWIGGSTLIRYDGYTFKNYIGDVQDSTSLKLGRVNGLYEDSDGTLWIWGRELYKYNRQNDTFILFKNKDWQIDSTVVLSGYLVVTAIEEDDKGNVLFGVGPPNGNEGNINHGLWKYDKDSEKMYKYELADSQHTNNIFSIKPKTGELWLGGDSGLMRINTSSAKMEIFRPDDLASGSDFIVTAIVETGDGFLWLATRSSGLYSFNPQDRSFTKYPIAEAIPANGLVADQDNILWLATNNGLIYFNPENGLAHKFTPQKNNPLSINTTNTRCLFQDYAGSVWIGTYNTGINRYDKSYTNFKAYVHDPTNPNSFGPGWADDFVEDKNHDILIGLGDADFIDRFNPRENSFSKIPLHGKLLVSAMLRDRQNRIWLGPLQGDRLYNLTVDGKGVIATPGFPQMPPSRLWCFYEDSLDNLWLGRSDGLWRYNKLNKSLKRSGEIAIQSIKPGKNNNIWLASWDGLFKFNLETEQLVRMPYKLGRIEYIDTRGVIWTAAWQNGFFRYDPAQAEGKQFTLKDGLPSTSVQGILGDEKNGALWLSTYGGGISRFDMNKETFHNYNATDGVHANLFAGGSAFKTSDGTLLFGGANGFTMFKPADISEVTTAPKVILTDFKISNKHVVPGRDGPLKKGIFDCDEIVLSHDQNHLTFEFTAIYFTNSRDNQYAYRLENYEDDWRYVGSQRSAIYPNLPAGQYIFQVKAANYNDVWNEEGAKVSIIINPPWWATWWAYMLYVLVGFGVLFSIRRFELNRRLMQAENKRKSEELEEARQLQLSMLPKELPQLPHLDIAVYMQTATEVGGDYYDFNVTMDSTLTVVIGDATGHGMKAGTMVTTAKSLFRSYGSNPDILFSFQEFSRCIKEMNFSRLSMCLTMLKISDHTMKIATAAMPPSYIYRSKTKEVEEYQFEAMPLGAMKNFQYKIKNTKLSTGDTILLLSDGLPELENKNGEMFGYSRIKDGFESIGEKSADNIISYLKNESAAWANNGDPGDDVTFVVIKVK